MNAGAIPEMARRGPGAAHDREPAGRGARRRSGSTTGATPTSAATTSASRSPSCSTRCDTEADLTLLGRWLTRRHLLRLLEVRRQMARYLQADPGVVDEPIETPAHRDGRAAHRDDDPARAARVPTRRCAHRSAGSCCCPCPPPVPGDAAAEQSRVELAELELRSFADVDPGLDAIHEYGARNPKECISAMSFAFRSEEFVVRYDVPSYTRWLAAVRHAARLRLPPAGARAAAAPQPAPAVGAEVAGAPAFAEHGARRLSRRQGRGHPSRSAGGARLGQQPRRASAVGAQRSRRPARPSAATTPSSTPARSTPWRRTRIRGSPSRAGVHSGFYNELVADPIGAGEGVLRELGAAVLRRGAGRECRSTSKRVPVAATEATSTRSPSSASTPLPSAPDSPRTPAISPYPTRFRDHHSDHPFERVRRRLGSARSVHVGRGGTRSRRSDGHDRRRSGRARRRSPRSSTSSPSGCRCASVPTPAWFMSHGGDKFEHLTQAGTGRLNPQALEGMWLTPDGEDAFVATPHPETGEVLARCMFTRQHVGPPGRVHGGSVATLLDHVVGFATAAVGKPGMTAGLDLRYKDATPVQRAAHSACAIHAFRRAQALRHRRDLRRRRRHRAQPSASSSTIRAGAPRSSGQLSR